jgi:hypothetical protein
MTITEHDGSWELVSGGWHFPTSIALGDDGMLYLAESGLPFAGAPPGGRVWRIDATGERTLLAGDLRAPSTGSPCTAASSTCPRRAPRPDQPAPSGRHAHDRAGRPAGAWELPHEHGSRRAR